MLSSDRDTITRFVNRMKKRRYLPHDVLLVETMAEEVEVRLFRCVIKSN